MTSITTLHTLWQNYNILTAEMRYSMTVKLLTAHHLEFQSLKGGCTGSSESTLVKIPHCWKYHAAAQLRVGANMVTCLLTW